MVPSFSEDVTRAMRGQSKRLSRNHARKHPALGQENNGQKLRVVLTRVLSRHEVMIATDITSFSSYVYALINKQIKNGSNIQPA